jgi:sialate O-acetylesterase
LRNAGIQFVKRVFLIIFVLLNTLHADVGLPSIFGNHMVLQQGVTLPIWGSASPGEHVTLTVGKICEETVADSSGQWRIMLPPLPMSPESFSMVICGGNRIEIGDVITGDVWICAGEGNMKSPLSDSSSGKDKNEKISDQNMRFFQYGPLGLADENDPRRQGRWVVCTPASAPSFSAVGYFFARDLRSSHHLPIGIIQCTEKKSPITSWISHGGLAKSPSILCNPDHVQGNSTPSSCFERLLQPIIPYAITGVIWYQGESDEGNSALQYRRSLQRLIRDWRNHWGEGPFPFYFVAQAGYGSSDGPVVEGYHSSDGFLSRGLPWLREGGSCALSLPYTGMAQATDLGVTDDRVPADKLDVGRRLALLARHRVYGEEITDSGPVYRGMKVEDDKVRVEFASAGGGLVIGSSPSKSGYFSPPLVTSLKGFALSGINRKWFPAQGRIEGKSVLLWSDAVRHPSAVRYGWKGFPGGTLYNLEGLPAVPFRSDTDQPE